METCHVAVHHAVADVEVVGAHLTSGKPERLSRCSSCCGAVAQVFLLVFDHQALQIQDAIHINSP
jgi:hypothetical protein